MKFVVIPLQLSEQAQSWVGGSAGDTTHGAAMASQVITRALPDTTPTFVVVDM